VKTRRPLVSWPLYRLLFVIALVPVLIAALAVREPPLPPAPTQPLPPFDGTSAANTAARMLSFPTHRGPGGDGDRAAANFIYGQLSKAGYRVSREQFAADLPGEPNVPMVNVLGFLPGRRADIIAVIAHHDGIGRGADDNDSSVGVMLELAAELQPLTRDRGLLMLSTDGGTSGGQGATYFAEHSPFARRIAAAIVLDSVAAPNGTPIGLVIRPDSPRGTSPTLFRTVRSAIGVTSGTAPIVPGLLDQLSGLAIPYALNEQGPLISRGVPAVTLTAGPPPDPADDFRVLDPTQLATVGNSTLTAVEQLDGAASIEPAGRPDIFVGSRTVRGWLAETALVALFAPALACTLDMAARCRRRRIPLAPGVAALGWRWLSWLAVLIMLWLLPVLPGSLASGLDIAPRPDAIGITWAGIALALLAGALTWRFASRPRLVPQNRPTGGDRTGGLATALLGLGFASTMLVAINPFALLLVLPAAHAWLLLPGTARYGRRAMLLAWLAGWTCVALLIVEYALRFHFGLSTPRALLSMTSSGYLSPAVAVCLTLAGASAAQLLAIIGGRYGPAHAAERLYN
jgi:hypothetical protein